MQIEAGGVCKSRGVYANPEPPATGWQARRLEKCDPAASVGPEMRDNPQRLPGPTSKSPANPLNSRKTAADLATVFSVRCYLTMEG